MNTQDVERRVAVTLARHAEAAMNSTTTDKDKLTRLLTNAETGRQRRRVWISGAAVAAIAAAVALIFWAVGLTSGKTDSQSPVPAGKPRPEQVATAYVEAYASFDRPLLRSMLAGDALASWPDLQLANQADEAIQLSILLDSCTAGTRGSAGTPVRCTYDIHALGSEQLGLGPYTGNRFDLTVLDGKVTTSFDYFDYGNNGFAVQVWEPFVAWLTDHYPADYAKMIDSNNDPLPNATSFALWHQHIPQYVAAKA